MNEENQVYFVDSDKLPPAALERKHRLEQDPSFRTDHMKYMDGMQVIESDIKDKVLKAREENDSDLYTANDNSAPTGDPQIWLETMYTGLGTSGKKNLTGFQDDKIDEIVRKMSETFKTEDRYALAAEASQVLNDDAANLFLTNSYLNMVSASKVKNANQPVADYYFITKDITVE